MGKWWEKFGKILKIIQDIGKTWENIGNSITDGSITVRYGKMMGNIYGEEAWSRRGIAFAAYKKTLWFSIYFHKFSYFPIIYPSFSGWKVDINRVLNPFRDPATPEIEFSMKNYAFWCRFNNCSTFSKIFQYFPMLFL